MLKKLLSRFKEEKPRSLLEQEKIAAITALSVLAYQPVSKESLSEASRIVKKVLACKGNWKSAEVTEQEAGEKLTHLKISHERKKEFKEALSTLSEYRFGSHFKSMSKQADTKVQDLLVRLRELISSL